MKSARVSCARTLCVAAIVGMVGAASAGAAVDGLAWVDLVPPHRTSHSAIYDPVRDRMLVFGGIQGYAPYDLPDDLWALPLDPGTPHWYRVSAGGALPPPVAGPVSVYDPAQDAMIMACHGCGVYALALANSTWDQLSNTGGPRYGASVVLDTRRDRLVMFGGFDPAHHCPVCPPAVTPYNEVWVLSLQNDHVWTQLFPHGTPPTPRYNHSAVYDSVGDRMVIFGGGTNETWALDFSGDSAWVQLAVGNRRRVRGHGLSRRWTWRGTRCCCSVAVR